MSIPQIVPPYPDLSNGYVVTELEWNGMFDTLYNYLNGQVKPAIDTIQATPASGATKEVNGLRMSLSSTDPAPSAGSSITGATSIYIHPYIHNKIGLYKGTAWQADELASPYAVSVPGGNPFRVGNIYAYDNLNFMNAEIDWWDSNARVTATISNITIGTSPVLTTTTAHGLVAGDVVGILTAAGSGSVYTDTDRGLNNKKWTVTGVTGTTLQLESWDSTGLTFGSSGGVIYKIPTAPYNPIQRKDGVPIKYLTATSTQDPTRRFIGTFITNGAGTVDFAPANGLLGLANFANTIPTRVTCYETLASWTFSDPGYSLPRSNSYVTGRVRIEFISALQQGCLIIGHDYGRIAVQLDRVFRWNETNWYTNNIDMITVNGGMLGVFTRTINTGAHFLQLTNKYVSGYSQTLYSQTTDSNSYGNMPGIDLLIGA